MGFYRDDRRQSLDINPNVKTPRVTGPSPNVAPAIGGSAARGSALRNGGNSAIIPTNQKPGRNKAAK